MLREKCKGITLVALVITIVILIILAGISISTLTNTGIFQKAKDAKKSSENAEKEQRQTLSEYERELNKYTAQELTDDKINKVLSETENIVLKDANGNIFTLPAGFKVVVNDDTGNAKTVDKGIVIEDATDLATEGSQFVWVPVGTIKKTDGTQTEIELNRYTFDEDGKPIPYGDAIIENDFSEIESRGNEIAKNIADFKDSIIVNDGYYIGRYEARKNDVTKKMTEVRSDTVYNDITQKEASTVAKKMYNNTNYVSDLIYSYAWDTAIVFIQNCDESENYSKQCSSNKGYIESKGTNDDKKSNIFDMASNLREWSTETSSSDTFGPCTLRGGCGDYDWVMTSSRTYGKVTSRYNYLGFRPILYINV